ncbi:MAG TPA: choice-of-anchor tandem repeat GloVer-containing protein, partial [Nevskiaceae bacterium]|nr:choice-of-anchor tandem repeat GloVer-containing protein [Nevskiaceae bacterium]
MSYPQGRWICTSWLGFAAVVAALALTPAQASAPSSVHDFTYDHGTYATSLIDGGDGSFYGTTYQGGARGYGTVFKLTHGVLTTLHSFNRTDGANPLGALLPASDGKLYGTTGGGGAQDFGTVFVITRDGTFNHLYDFDGTHGYLPTARLIQDSDGSFYGTTQGGGTAAGGNGTVFRITGNGAITTLHSFSGGDGFQPESGLTQTADGTFYGTTYAGGTGGAGT